MIATDRPSPTVVSRAEWLAARIALLAKERELTQQRDRIAAERRALPWVRLDTDYVFDAPGGRRSLSDLFVGRSQLAVYHFMLPPESDYICAGCALVADHIDAARQHFEHAELALAAVSRASVARIEQVQRRFGWRFAWVSSGGNSFNGDFGVSFTPDRVARRDTGYNYGTTDYAAPDLPGISIFAKDEAGRVCHTYSAYARGVETVVGAFNWLDLTPKGRNEGSTMSWLRLHDEYDSAAGAHDCCAG